MMFQNHFLSNSALTFVAIVTINNDAFFIE
jgi:hypothetical protein